MTKRNRQRIANALEYWQHGTGKHGGAIRIVWKLQQRIKDLEESDIHVTFALDARSASGEVNRSAIMKKARTAPPDFAQYLAAMWDTDTTINLKVEGKVETSVVRDGLVQGGCEAQEVFCFGLSQAVGEFRSAFDQDKDATLTALEMK